MKDNSYEEYSTNDEEKNIEIRFKYPLNDTPLSSEECELNNKNIFLQTKKINELSETSNIKSDDIYNIKESIVKAKNNILNKSFLIREYEKLEKEDLYQISDDIKYIENELNDLKNIINKEDTKSQIKSCTERIIYNSKSIINDINKGNLQLDYIKEKCNNINNGTKDIITYINRVKNNI